MAVGYVDTISFSEVEVYSSTTRLSTELEVNTGANEKWEPIYRVRLDNIGTDELIVVHSSVEVTNDLNHPCSVVTKIVVNSNYDDEPGENGAFVISAGGGPNVHKNVQHHELYNRHAVWIPTSTFGARNITVMGRAVSSAAKPNETVDLTQAPGELKVLRYT